MQLDQSDDGPDEDGPADDSNEDVRKYIPDDILNGLNERREVDFVSEMADLYSWLTTTGKDLDESEGHTESTAQNYLYRISRILALIWDREGEYTLLLSPEDGDWVVERLKEDDLLADSGDEYSNSTKRKETCALLAFFRFRWDERNGEPWTPKTLFKDDSGANIADPITLEERSILREAVLDYKTVKAYNSCTPEERDRIKALLAQRLGKPKEEVTKADWTRANTSWKYPSLIMSTLDAELRPIEVERMTVDWLSLSDSTLKIPKEDAAKNDEEWKVALTERTVKALRRWLQQREKLPKYDDTSTLWLTRHGNPYSSGTLSRRLRDIMDEAGIDYDDRDISWYSLRHSLGTELATQGDIKQVKEQLRHKKIESSLQYNHPTNEQIRDNLNRIS